MTALLGQYLKPQQREQFILEAVTFWKACSEDYRTRVDRYNALLAEMRKECPSKPLRKLPVDVINHYPKIDFLTIASEEKVKTFLMGLPDYQLEHLVAKTRNKLETDHSYKTVGARISDYQAALEKKRRGKISTRGAPDPDRLR